LSSRNIVINSENCLDVAVRYIVHLKLVGRSDKIEAIKNELREKALHTTTNPRTAQILSKARERVRYACINLERTDAALATAIKIVEGIEIEQVFSCNKNQCTCLKCGRRVPIAFTIRHLMLYHPHMFLKIMNAIAEKVRNL